MKYLYIVFFLFTNSAHAKTEEVKLFKVSTKNGTYAYDGLTDDGLTAIKLLRNALRTRHQLFNNEFKSLQNTHHALMVARLFQGNAFLYGPPGGAKSAIIEWMFKGETEQAFQLQLHQMMTEQAFVGGQDFEKAKEGMFEVNTKGSLAEYKVALIDEVEKGNPAALSALLSLLNERKILAGNKVIKAETETVFATSNSNLPELRAQFDANGQGSTAPALLNRFQFKCFVYNWLSAGDQSELDARRDQKRRLQALLHGCPEATSKSEIFLEIPKLDFAQMRLLANVMMETDASFKVAYRNLAEAMRLETNKAVCESEERHKKSRYDEPFVYFPSCDYTERLRQQIPEVVRYSAFIDFLLSDLADDNHLKITTKKPLVLGALSLWRAHLVMTTVGPGDVKLIFNNEVKADLEFNMTVNESTLRDHREVQLLKNLKEEQDRFKRTFLNLVKDTQASIATASRYSKNANVGDGGDFELRIQRN